MTDFPTDVQYSREHEWVTDITQETVTVGITAHAAEALGEIVYVDLPAVGDSLTAGETCGELESTKSVSDLYTPVSGVVTEVNSEVVDEPSLINDDPFGEGWLFRVQVESAGELLTAAEYQEFVG